MTKQSYERVYAPNTDTAAVSEKEYKVTVGLLSMQRVVNYGSFWQAYCLKNMIEKVLPCNVEFVDIMPGEANTIAKHKPSFSFSKIRKIPCYIFYLKRHSMFRKFQKVLLGCSDEPNYRSDYDAVIIGSDEVFNCVQKTSWGFSPQLYGDIANENVSSYAASFGYTTMDAITRNGWETGIAKGLRNLRNLSVRDQNSEEIVRNLMRFTPEKHLDPVAVGDFPQELPAIRDRDYILIYSYDLRMSEPDMKCQVQAFAKKHNLKVISAGFYQDWVDKNVLPTPMELLSYFKNADYVVTDTFHGTLFSERMHRKFVTIIRETNKQKLGDLLEMTEMTERIYTAGDSLREILTSQIDYRQFETFRLSERRRTETYLKKCLAKLE